jgi:hypothetical protein
MPIHPPVVGIDFGATYTKVSYRNEFVGGFRDDLESHQSTVFKLDDEQLIPSLVVETGREDRPWLFGRQAAEIRPGKKMTVHHNWKSRLIKADGSDSDPKSLEIAVEFFKWLRAQLANSVEIPFALDEATVRLCVPAFDHSGSILSRLGVAMQMAGWTNKLLLKTSEPKANAIGYCTRGQNIRLWTGMPDWSDMFDENSPFIRFTRRDLTGISKAALAVLDIGSFTSDLSIVYWTPGDTTDYLDEGKQVSFAHGIVADLDDQCLQQILEDAGESWDQLEFDEHEQIKERLYSHQTYNLSGNLIGGAAVQIVIKDAIDRFAERLIHLLAPHVENVPINWFLLTGGGSNIVGITDKLTAYFQELRVNGTRPFPLKAHQTGNRLDTAMGATSIILENRNDSYSTYRTDTDSNARVPLPPLENCPCQGINPSCIRCGGTGILDESQQSRRTPRQVHPGAVLPIVAERVLVEEETVTEDLGNTLDFINSDDPAPRVFTPEQIKQHTLEGWMGDLVFPSHPKNYAEYRKALRSDDTEQQNAAWYRLLCFGCTLGARVSRQTIRNFWGTTLNRTNFWEITTGGSLDQKKLDQFFEELIHREFNSVYAEGEQAELLRRVFYDFRKLHYLVYFNDFPNVVLQILDDTDHGADPIKFLRSGWLPDGTRWKGVIGQSMTSPLLFLMREWRRMGLIAADKHDHHCFYMNSPAARAAIRKGWLDWNRYGRGDLQSILDSSRTVHEQVRTTGAWSIMDFDIPLQILGTP